MRMRLRIKSQTLLILGLAVLTAGFFMPLVLTVDRLGIIDDLMAAIRLEDDILLLWAANKLVTLNTLRCLPYYLGTFIIADAVGFQEETTLRKLFKSLVMFALIYLVYRLTDFWLNIHYDFGVAALTMILLIILFSNAAYDFVQLPKKLIMATLFIAAVQQTDVMPFLAALPVGRGGASMEVKLTAEFLQCTRELQVMTSLLFVLFLFMGFLVLVLVRDENNLRKLDLLTRENQKIRLQAQWQELENRSNQEIRHLVHDLKSPLTSCQGLVTLAQYICQQEGHQQIADYLVSAEQSIDRMNSMISDILSDQHKALISTQDLLDAALAQLSVSPHAEKLHSSNSIPEELVLVNKIRFIRALVNLVENAFFAVSAEDGSVMVSVAPLHTNGSDWVQFSVEDNGSGIAPEILPHIWEQGVSTRHSSGLGLNFVQKVVSDAQGTISVQSEPGKGTTFTIQLPKGDVEYDATVHPNLDY